MKKMLAILLMFMSLSAMSYETINLNKNNTVILDKTVDYTSVSLAQEQMLKIDQNLEKNKPIYLVLDTPGGSIFAGTQFIDFAKALDRPVHTVTIFAASMGYQIAQNLGTRYILPSGVLMSHRAYVGGLRGQVPGEANVMLTFLQDYFNGLDQAAADRVGLSIKDYQTLIRDEFWTFGGAAIAQKHADKLANVVCDKSLNTRKSHKEVYYGFTITYQTNSCPLIPGLFNFQVKNRYGKIIYAEDQGTPIGKYTKKLKMRITNKRMYFTNYVKGNETF